ncbi:MAG: hypothetical protein AAFR12_05350 [Cyanobacteria bacterium J06626_6]
MSDTFQPSETDMRELAAQVDLSDVIAEIDVLCYRLDFYEMGQWWDYTRSSRKLTHPAVTSWMEHYGFSGFSDLPSSAVIAVRNSLQKYLESAKKGITPTVLVDGGLKDDG